ncbi:hypothetical protein [Polymorphobacter fuscus]|uniref:DUF3718 domain-containing protein n=1 Tax=Sandarakinorhabdus fusca TaxID=1439888 RepID=A0A7C9KL13_9SPHN|nr:hypothetical protein [Polymorphobacter fuscus]KAB7648479.1 hypothetical protein F9290_01835 [Polymorphobacter fuscus]MQT16004.1 hypothetical protein [Polymorphobacter fuscus]NJC07719.1 hypothetical protein [Polymorphobacter fuscus]
MINRFLSIALGAALVGAAAAPAMAADSVCTRTPEQIRTLAVSASADNARKALNLVNIGEKLCDAGARGEAGKKFSAAAKLLGTDLAAVNAAPTAQ